jgi:hypothetical protein
MQSTLWGQPPLHSYDEWSFPENHPDMARLDHLKQTVSYPGWQEDFIRAIRAVYLNPEDLEDSHIFRMEEKQRMFLGNRSHKRLVKLDSLVFTYPGWQLDIYQVEAGHVRHKSGCFYDEALEGMLNKERVFNGDRSHPDLRQLDRLKRALSYPGWEQDVYIAEESHLTHPRALKDQHLFKLMEKQRMHLGVRTHPRLVQLDSMSWTYPGWQSDKNVAEAEHVEAKESLCFDSLFRSMKYRQLLFEAMERRCAKKWLAIDDSSATNEDAKADPLGNCAICMSEPKTHAFIPCGHHFACEICALEIFERTSSCPICRQEADDVLQIFFS